MKSLLIYSLAILILRNVEVLGFMAYPFIASNILGKFLDGFNITAKDYAQDLMKNAVQGEKCMRECRENEYKICYFNFTLKHYQIMGG